MGTARQTLHQPVRQSRLPVLVLGGPLFSSGRPDRVRHLRQARRTDHRHAGLVHGRTDKERTLFDRQVHPVTSLLRLAGDDQIAREAHRRATPVQNDRRRCLFELANAPAIRRGKRVRRRHLQQELGMDRAEAADRRQPHTGFQFHGGEPTLLVQTNPGDLLAAEQFHARFPQRLLEGLHPRPAAPPDQAGRFIVRAHDLAVEQQGSLLGGGAVENPMGTQKTLEHGITGALVERLLETASGTEEEHAKARGLQSRRVAFGGAPHRDESRLGRPRSQEQRPALLPQRPHLGQKRPHLPALRGKGTAQVPFERLPTLRKAKIERRFEKTNMIDRVRDPNGPVQGPGQAQFLQQSVASIPRGPSSRHSESRNRHRRPAGQSPTARATGAQIVPPPRPARRGGCRSAQANPATPPPMTIVSCLGTMEPPTCCTSVLQPASITGHPVSARDIFPGRLRERDRHS